MRKNRKGQIHNEFRLLVLDDDEMITLALRAYFEGCGYTVDIESNPLRAIEKIRLDHYDILLLESLIQLLRRLHKKPRTPVETGTSVLCCGALAWHIASGIVFLGLMLAGISYAVMIGTESYLLQEMWGIVL